MKNRMLRLQTRWKSDYQFKTYFSSAWSCMIGIGFALFNAVLGILYRSVWNGSISVYYMLLTIVRGVIVSSRKLDHTSNRRICLRTHILMMFMDLCLVAPIAYMVMGERTYRFGQIPAITMAAYTTYRVAMGIIQYLSSRKHNDLLVKELRVINLQDALVAVLSLQNALIIANGTTADSMIPLTGWTSAAIWLTIVFFTVRSYLSVKRNNGQQTF